MSKTGVDLTLTCDCGVDLREDAEAIDNIDGIVRCVCGARYAYSATMLLPPDADEPVEELAHYEPTTGER